MRKKLRNKIRDFWPGQCDIVHLLGVIYFIYLIKQEEKCVLLVHGENILYTL